MNINDYDYVEPQSVSGKIILTCFPGRENEGISFKEDIFFNELKFFNQFNCSIIVSLIEDKEIENLYEKKKFVRNIYTNNLKWMHMPIYDLKAPDYKFVDKWQTTKSLLKNDLIDGKYFILDCHYETDMNDCNMTVTNKSSYKQFRNFFDFSIYY